MLFSKSVIFSNPKAENVVKPQQNPVIKNHFKLEFVKLNFSKTPINIPIKKQPKTLVINVAIGKWFDQYFITKTAVKYRKTLSIAPPVAI